MLPRTSRYRESSPAPRQAGLDVQRLLALSIERGNEIAQLLLGGRRNSLVSHCTLVLLFYRCFLFWLTKYREEEEVH